MDAVKPEYFDQMREMYKCFYAAGLNIDYNPTNFVVQDDVLYYIDYERNSYIEEWNFENWGIHHWVKTQDK